MTATWTSEFDTSLALDDYDFTITSARFGRDQNYNNGNSTILILEGVTDNEDYPTNTYYVSLGNGWETLDGGLSIVFRNKKGTVVPDKYFTERSAIGVLINRVVNQLGILEVLSRRGGPENKEGTPFDSWPWIGLKFHMKSEKVNYGTTNNSGGGVVKAMPQEFLGLVDPSTVTVPVSATAGATASPVQNVLADLRAASGKNLRDQVIEIIRNYPDDFDKAQAAAMEVPGVAEDEELVDSLLDASGLFAEVNG